MKWMKSFSFKKEFWRLDLISTKLESLYFDMIAILWLELIIAPLMKGPCLFTNVKPSAKATFLEKIIGESYSMIIQASNVF